MEKIKAILALIVSAGAAASIIGTVAWQAGWVIPRSEAQAMVDTAMQLVASQAAQATLDEAKARQIADLRFQIELVTQKIADLLNNDARTPGQDFELGQLEKQLDSLNAQLSAAQQ